MNADIELKNIINKTFAILGHRPTRLFICLLIALVSCAPQPPSPGAIRPTPTDVTPASTDPALLASSDWTARFLGRVPCEPPCWEGVTPGLTTADDAFRIFKSSPALKNVQMPDANSYGYGSISWNWADRSGGGYAHYYVHNKIIGEIKILQPPRYIVENVIKAYGEPKHIAALRVRNVEAMETGRGIYGTYFVYLGYGFALGESGLYDKPSLGKDMNWPVLTFFGTTRGSFEDALGVPFESLVPWEGFKSFDYYCRDEGTLEPCE